VRPAASKLEKEHRPLFAPLGGGGGALEKKGKKLLLCSSGQGSGQLTEYLRISISVPYWSKAYTW